MMMDVRCHYLVLLARQANSGLHLPEILQADPDGDSPEDTSSKEAAHWAKIITEQMISDLN
jgi:hypothetical protein